MRPTKGHQSLPTHAMRVAARTHAQSLTDGTEAKPDVADKAINGTDTDTNAWAVLWGTQAAWLEGACLNCVYGGEAECSAVLGDVVRLWLTCCTPGTDAPEPLSFALPRDALDALALTLIYSSLVAGKSNPHASVHAHALCQPLTALLAQYALLAHWLPAMEVMR
jgi:hypothetical protein